MATIKLDRERLLRYTLSSVRRFKEVYGKPLAEVRMRAPESSISEILDPSCLAVVIWAGLIHEDEKLTTDKLERLLERYISGGGRLVDFFEPVGNAMKESRLFDQRDDKDKEEEGKAEGASSTP